MLAVAIRTPGECRDRTLLEMIGAAIGGATATRWPDVLEPANHPRHRKVAHSWTVGFGVLGTAPENVRAWEAACRNLSTWAATRGADMARAPAERALFRVVALVASILAGLLVGIAAGYLSHLVLDGLDPSGLPMLGLA
jgi:hypothetical protein